MYKWLSFTMNLTNKRALFYNATNETSVLWELGFAILHSKKKEFPTLVRDISTSIIHTYAVLKILLFGLIILENTLS
jgi:hypothetical protein